MPRKVFVVNYCEQDFTSATRFGELEYLTTGKVQNIFNIEGLLHTMREKLSKASDEDYILLCGSPVLNVIAVGIMVIRYGVANILIFDAKTRDYQPRTITDNQLAGVSHA